MARILIVYWLPPAAARLSTYRSHLRSLSRFSNHECLYFNAAQLSVPGHIAKFRPDLVVFHYTFCLPRYSSEFERTTELIKFVRDLDAKKVLISADESHETDQLVKFIMDFDISEVFTFAPRAAIPVIYAGVDNDRVSFHSVLSGYVDARLINQAARMEARRAGKRRIDVGARMVVWHILGRHGQLKARICDEFLRAAPATGLLVDISTDSAETLEGTAWLRFLMDSRFTLGVETGSSLLDRDGSATQRLAEYMRTHTNATFDEAESACFPGLDGNLDYRALAPRHLEAIIAKSCQILIEGDYSGVLEPGIHYIELKRDFSNLDAVLNLLHNERTRQEIAERAYRDIVLSGSYSYSEFASQVFRVALPLTSAGGEAGSGPLSSLVLKNRLNDYAFELVVLTRGRFARLSDSARKALRPMVSRIIGEDHLRRILATARSLRSRQVN